MIRRKVIVLLVSIAMLFIGVILNNFRNKEEKKILVPMKTNIEIKKARENIAIKIIEQGDMFIEKINNIKLKSKLF